ncbi:MAG: DUF4252 domain-containing protein [Bacteroidetes bacterium]|nr:DUF4252 domain-containing protein [Bacteroidota bacterium]
MNKIKIIIAAIVFLSINVLSQSTDITKEPGYVDFGDFTSIENTTNITEIILDEDLLSVLASMSDESDPNIMSILNGIKLVKANVYEISDDNKDLLRKRINEIDSKLTNSNWKRIVKTRSKDEMANVYIKLNNDKKIVGLAVTNFEKDGEAAFVNIVGNIDLATIGKLGKKFGISQLEGMKKNNDGDSDEKQ